ncbi:MAG: shikimate kinase [Candidatus Eisenbacteria bacterium]|uniref:Shikimate kinase n=1 Tax=Eiseniibacteriota bacterium TaxID=2212470 RepID=A0A956NCG6_UNCEI|nr:shikimate kinase [Candidatus Eisenbacteria bacterium]MCB9462671.1 shikimate kinase [Candidatus Eisenbacteria bacterium]
MLAPKNIALIGFMAAGKTHVGRRLGERTGMPFVDIDLLIMELEQNTVEEIFRVKGEPYFRGIESRLLGELCRGSGQIIGCGGGTILAEENRRTLAQRCETVWLRVSEAQVLRRLEDPDAPRRPLLEGLDATRVVHDLLQAREPYYAQADHVVETDGRTVEAVAEEIVVRLGLAAADR